MESACLLCKIFLIASCLNLILLLFYFVLKRYIVYHLIKELLSSVPYQFVVKIFFLF